MMTVEKDKGGKQGVRKNTPTASPVIRVGKNGQPRYPWEEWFSKAYFVLRKGVDYNCRTYVMVQQIRNAAGPTRFNKSIAVRVNADETTIRVRVKK